MKFKQTRSLPLAALAVILLVLLPVFMIMTRDRLQRQEELFSQKLLEKGISLIRTFEAGTRTGMLDMRWGARRIQMLLAETAIQPDVEYMMIVDKDGQILSHSDPQRIGSVYDRMPETENLKDNPSVVASRILHIEAAQEIFEVVKRFEPVRGKMGHGPGKMRHMQMMMEEQSPRGNTRPEKDWSKVYQHFKPHEPRHRGEHYIIAGLSMERAKTVRDKLVKETVFQGTIYFLLAVAGMTAVFVFQAYRAARASLSSIKAYSETIIQNMPSGLVTADDTGRVMTMNDAAGQLIGTDTARLPAPFRKMISGLKDEQTIVSREIQVKIGPEKSILLDVTASGIMDNDNREMGFLFLFKDLTQVKELQQQVETNKRLAAIGKLAAGVAHEIRNPLSSIKGFATYFGRRYEDNEADRETADIMVKEVERINRSVTQLLEFAKPMPVKRSVVDLQSVIDHSLKLVAPDLDTGEITTSLEFDDGLPIVYTDGDRLNQVLLNLYMNALQAMGPGGHLIIRAMQPDNKQVAIEICDDGCGMDQDVIERAFEPYFTTKATGTGLGLSIVHRIVENLGGSIHAKSSPGQGSCFKLILPVGEKDDD